MPVYDFKCRRCDAIEEIIMSLKKHQKAQIFCNNCGAEMTQILSTPPFIERVNLRIGKPKSRRRHSTS